MTSPDPSEPADRLDLTGRTGRGLVLTGGAYVTGRLLGFATTVVLARVLTPDVFGIAAATMTFVLYAQAVLDLGVGGALVYEQERGITQRVYVAFTINFVVVVVLTLAGVAAAPWIADFFHVRASADVFRVTALSVFLMGVGAIPRSLLERDLSFGRRSVVDIADSAIRAGVAIPLALVGFGVWAFVWGTLAGAFVATTLAFVFVRLPPILAFSRRIARSLLEFGLSLTGVRVIEEFGLNADYLVVGGMLGPAALGAYTLAYRLPEMALDGVYWMAGRVLFPSYSSARVSDASDVGRALVRAVRLLVLYGATVGVGIALTAADLTDVIYSSKWAVASGAMSLIALKMALNAVSNSVGDVFPAVGRPNLLLVTDMIVVGLQIPAFIVATRWGILGVAAVHLVAQLLMSVTLSVIGVHVVAVRARTFLGALRPATVAVAGIVAFALAPRLLLPAGAGRLAVTVGAGVAGAAVALWLGGRDAIDEAVDLARATLGRGDSTRS